MRGILTHVLAEVNYDASRSIQHIDRPHITDRPKTAIFQLFNVIKQDETSRRLFTCVVDTFYDDKASMKSMLTLANNVSQACF
jgi:hypothetical protein